MIKVVAALIEEYNKALLTTVFMVILMCLESGSFQKEKFN